MMEFTKDEIEYLAFAITQELRSHGVIGYSSEQFDYVRHRVGVAIIAFERDGVPPTDAGLEDTK